MLTDEELAAVDDWRFSRRMPSRAAAVRELLKSGLAAEGFALASRTTKSKEFGILPNAKLERLATPQATPGGEIRSARK